MYLIYNNVDVNRIKATIAYGNNKGFFKSNEVEESFTINNNLDMTLQFPHVGAESSLLSKINKHQRRILEKLNHRPIFKNDIESICKMLGTMPISGNETNGNYIFCEPNSLLLDLTLIDLRQDNIKLAKTLQEYEAFPRFGHYARDNKEELHLKYTLTPKYQC